MIAKLSEKVGDDDLGLRALAFGDETWVGYWILSFIDRPPFFFLPTTAFCFNTLTVALNTA
jgi:hypothetical protein